MAKPRKYTERRTARFDKATDKLLVKRAKFMKVEPAVAIRAIVERELKLQTIDEAIK